MPRFTKTPKRARDRRLARHGPRMGRSELVRSDSSPKPCREHFPASEEEACSGATTPVNLAPTMLELDCLEFCTPGAFISDPKPKFSPCVPSQDVTAWTSPPLLTLKSGSINFMTGWTPDQGKQQFCGRASSDDGCDAKCHAAQNAPLQNCKNATLL